MNLDRILAHVSTEPSGCWVWQGCVDRTNPVIHVSKPVRKLISARRYTYEVHNQVCVPSGFVVTSICKNSLCVNPAHLAAVVRGKHGHRLIGDWKSEHCQRGHEFSPWNTGTDPRSGKHFCVACDKEHAREYAAKRRRDMPEYVKAIRLTRAATLRQWVREQKTACSRCGETDTTCLDFHHIDPAHKKFSISSEAGNYSRGKLLAEIAKCDLLCSNCHRKLHATERVFVNPKPQELQ